ncbi:uncharacterized protein [Apostichopus japonicus]|uniref:uncharacterized protein isoform X2 n=1 Tax=Stichopus japonicus TaxID=307972 RepID=UPI003AB6393A
MVKSQTHRQMTMFSSVQVLLFLLLVLFVQGERRDDLLCSSKESSTNGNVVDCKCSRNSSNCLICEASKEVEKLWWYNDGNSSKLAVDSFVFSTQETIKLNICSLLNHSMMITTPCSKENQAVYSCRSRNLTITKFFLKLQVTPVVLLNGGNVTGDNSLLIMPNKNETIQCKVLDAVLPISITWYVNNGTKTEVFTETFNNGTAAISYYTVQDASSNFNLHCSVEGPYISKQTATLTILTGSNQHGINLTISTRITTALVIIAILLGILVVLLFLRNMKITLSRNRRGNQSSSSSHPMKILDKGPLDINQSINQKGGRKELPEIPADEDNSQNSHHSEGSEPNYYSTADAIAGKDPRMLSEKDISIIINIKMGKIYKRWMGSVNLAEETNKCVVVTTLTEKLIRKKEIHWEAYIRKCLELPASNHLAKTEAISIQSSKLFLISEHLNCENLHSVLSRDTKNKGDYYCCSSLSVPDVIKHVAGVLEGMDILKTFGFLHPGLTTKKVLLTKEGQVKLFDFCLAGDAPKIAGLKKAQISKVTLNQFPPELLLLSQYTESSDVWSTAVVIWEIMAAGNPPFPVDKEVSFVEEAVTPSAPWPEKYLQIKDKILFDCWNHNCSLRPSIHHLRGTFVAKFEKLIGDSSYEIPIPTTYVPMGAANTDQATYAEHIYHAGN